MSEKITLGALVGLELEEDFLQFDLTDIQKILANLSDTDVIDLAHTEFLQQQTLCGANILAEYLGRIIKTTSYLESKINTAKNKAALLYKDPDATKTTADMKKYAGESSPEVAEIGILLAKAKGSKAVLEKKYDIILKAHHHYKELSMGLRRSILGSGSGADRQKVAEGWE